MKVKAAKWGNSLGVRLPKAVVDRLGLAPGREVEITLRGDVAELKTKANAGRVRYRPMSELIAEMDALGPSALPPFEDWGVLPSEWPDYEEVDPDVPAR